jgi:hypothetical protein
MGKWLVILGIGIAAIGILLHFFPNAFAWFGRLPGDIRITNERVRFYMPITSMILISIVLSLILYLIRSIGR